MIYAVFGRRTTSWNLSAPMLALLAGFVVFYFADDADIDLGAVHLLAEVTLVLVLFHDAATVRLSGLVKDYGLPLRLLAIGFPLALATTFGAAWALFPGLGALGALLLAAALTPTDAGLGAATVLNPAHPIEGAPRTECRERSERTGMATPIVLLALSGLATAAAPESEQASLAIGLVPVIIAIALALAVGLTCLWLIDCSTTRGWSTTEGRQIIVLMVPMLLLGLAEVAGGNAFIAGIVGWSRVRGRCDIFARGT